MTKQTARLGHVDVIASVGGLLVFGLATLLVCGFWNSLPTSPLTQSAPFDMAAVRDAKRAVSEAWRKSPSYEGLADRVAEKLPLLEQGKLGFVGPLGLRMTLEFNRNDPSAYAVVVDGLDQNACLRLKLGSRREGAMTTVNRASVERDRGNCLAKEPNRLEMVFKMPVEDPTASRLQRAE
jgi:hypothetical protein